MKNSVKSSYSNGSHSPFHTKPHSLKSFLKLIFTFNCYKRLSFLKSGVLLPHLLLIIF